MVVLGSEPGQSAGPTYGLATAGEPDWLDGCAVVYLSADGTLAIVYLGCVVQVHGRHGF